MELMLKAQAKISIILAILFASIWYFLLISLVIGAVFIFVIWDILIAIGVVAAIVPVEVPIAVEIIDVIKILLGLKSILE